MLDKTYDAHALEARLYPQWEEAGAFACRPDSGREPYTIVIPPPNVTGSLHMGHALNNTLQDILIRYQRMRGRDTLWQPGMDHAGIATQMVVERQLEEAGSSRLDMGREEFVERVWDWKAHSGGTITGQLRRLGASCDWDRERFTMDEGLSRAVLKVFVDLYKQGLIFKDNRLVNWDPKLHTAISDLEVQQREVRGKLWYFRYPLEDDPSRWVVVATTRPETMLGDTGVAVHPDDERYRDLVGKHVILPLVGRRIPVVADEYADPEQGSGAVKITPAHDFNDFEVGRRCGLETISVMDELARINDNAPEPYRGLDRFEARTRVVADIEAAGLLDKVEDHTHMVPYGDRGGVPIEPFLTEQWYVDAATLAKPAIQAVEQGRTKFVPENWTKTYYDWMHNIQPWCISRQLWWGHQIPAWYGPDGEVFVELSESEAQAAAEAHYGKPVALTRDPDVLDTWFSSALWPFSTLGWPDETPQLARYYPTDVLVTAFDIIFFWVARMMMMGLHFMDEVPFHTVYIHALVRDEKGEKMSKSKGNIIDPLVLIDKFGADALRFTLAAMAAMGRDIKLAESRVEGYRNFGTKLWNAARLCEMNGCKPDPDFDPEACRLTLNKWITGEAVELSRRVSAALDAYRFNEAASAIYQFVWHSFCDWYLESAKPVFLGQDQAAKAETQATAAWVLDRVYRLLHPFMPYITEELAAHLHGESNRGWLVDQPWPGLEEVVGDPAAAAEMTWVIELINEARSLRSQMNVPAGAKIPLALTGADATARSRLETHRDLIERMARLSEAEVADDVSRNGVIQFPVEGATAVLLLDGVIDISQESARLERETAKLDGDIAKLDKKLANEQFLAKAPEAVVEEQRERRADFVAARDKLRRALESLRAA